jgi:hypothetical protein
MSPIWRKNVPFLAAALSLGALALCPPASAASGPVAVNLAVAQNAQSGSSVSQHAWKVVRTSGPVLVARNAAVVSATGSSTSTVAVAFEIVTAGHTDQILADNRASTDEVRCLACQAAAVAMQWIVVSNAEVRLTPAGQAALAQIDRALNSLLRSGVSPAQVDAACGPLEDDVNTVLAHDVVAVPGASGSGSGQVRAALDRRPRALPPVPGPTASTTAGLVLPENGYTIYRYGQSSFSSGAGTSSVVAS